MNKGVLGAIIGIRYLIKYVRNKNIIYFEAIKEYEDEIKLWSLITLFANNMDDLWEDVPDIILHDLFLDNRCGKYSSTSTKTFKEQFKYIRNRLSHGDFTYQDRVIYFYDEENTFFDIDFLENLVLSTIANEKFKFQKNMSDIAILSLLPKGETTNFDTFLKKNYIYFYRITLLTSNKERLGEYFKISDKNRLTFDLVFQSVKYQIETSFIKSSSGEMREGLLKTLLSVEKALGSNIKLELIDLHDVDNILKSDEFKVLDFKEKLQYLINKIKLEDSYTYNTIILNHLFMLLKSRNDLVSDSLIVNDSMPFLLKVYATILFSCVYNHLDYDISLKNNLKESVSFDSHYVYAKNVYKEYLRVLKRSYDEAILYCAPKDYSNYLVGLIKYYQKLLDDVLDGESDKHLFWNLRNATTHNQIEFKDGFIRFYITGKHIHLYHYHKKKKEWVPKDFSNNETIWEMKIKEEELLHLLDLLSKYQNIPTSINISKLKRRKKDVSPHLIKQHE